MDDILKEAIADAKALRATALENAKIALEEAFTPRLKSMLSQKIQSEDLPDNEEYGEGGRVKEVTRTIDHNHIILLTSVANAIFIQIDDAIPITIVSPLRKFT